MQGRRGFNEVILYRLELCGIIKEAVMGIEIERYKDSVAPLIKNHLS